MRGLYTLLVDKYMTDLNRFKSKISGELALERQTLGSLPRSELIRWTRGGAPRRDVVTEDVL